MDQDYVRLYKILLIGNSSVGKSSILLRFTDKVFSESYLPTIGVDFKTIHFEQTSLQIWDTAGQERFKNITTSYYKGAHGIILVYDITDRQSFKDIQTWLAEVDKYGSENVVKLLVGNKSDLENERKVKLEEGETLGNALDIRFLETSAKGDTNVQGTFHILLNEIKEKMRNFPQAYKKQSKASQLPTLKKEQAIKNSKCCG